ncbi:MULTISPECIES: maleylpyruvate isomerase N-terminal domain-containing protein [Thermomonosporaceae]|uniref:maleylpyruvate isomerase N-terminal domain-containing protein n=1 Tax=Thermomonosporaceae TaxID=2012 RepID=UPI00255B2247|nr:MULTISPECIES: maleylpyruvate isomerase N-terminal domain-containing protein [Thermomonosporaceae]MDL4777359.1 maleylpyruvate isomerase N-terminal domain-containing protein [Actinomadura xylanilytica]
MERVPNPVAYRRVRENVARLLGERPEVADRTVPACPDWTVRGLVAHLAEICARGLGAPVAEPPPASAAVPDLLRHWNGLAEEFERAVADGTGEMNDLLVADAFVHEGDIRAVLGEAMPDGHPAYVGVMELGILGFSFSLASHGLPAVGIEAGDLRWTAGAGEPAITMRGNRHDVVRSIGGRRTHEQIARLSWSADPGPWLPAFTWGPFTPPAHPVEMPAADS